MARKANWKVVREIDERTRKRESAERLLTTLVAEQRADSLPEKLGFSQDMTTTQLFQQFSRHRAFRDLYEEALALPARKRDIEELYSFKGSLFRDLAHAYVAEIIPVEITLLSPQRTVEYLRHHYPERIYRRSNYGHIQLKDRDSFQGLIVGQTSGKNTISDILKYTCKPIIDPRPSLGSFHMDRIIVHSINNDARVIYCVPQGSQFSYAHPQIHQHILPFSLQDMSAFFGYVGKCRDRNIPTNEMLDAIQSRN